HTYLISDAEIWVHNGPKTLLQRVQALARETESKYRNRTKGTCLLCARANARGMVALGIDDVRLVGMDLTFGDEEMGHALASGTVGGERYWLQHGHTL